MHFAPGCAGVRQGAARRAGLLDQPHVRWCEQLCEGHQAPRTSAAARASWRQPSMMSWPALGVAACVLAAPRGRYFAVLRVHKAQPAALAAEAPSRRGLARGARTDVAPSSTRLRPHPDRVGGESHGGAAERRNVDAKRSRCHARPTRKPKMAVRMPHTAGSTLEVRCTVRATGSSVHTARLAPKCRRAQTGPAGVDVTAHANAH